MSALHYAQERLTTLGAPVLSPHEFGVPMAYKAPGKQLGGFPQYLAAHPSGFVQLHEPTGITAGLELAVVDVIAPTRGSALLLADTVRRAVAAPPSRWAFARLSLSEPLESAAWRVQHVYTVTSSRFI